MTLENNTSSDSYTSTCLRLGVDVLVVYEEVVCLRHGSRVIVVALGKVNFQLLHQISISYFVGPKKHFHSKVFYF